MKIIYTNKYGKASQVLRLFCHKVLLLLMKTKKKTGYKTLEANIRCVVQVVVILIFFSLLCRSWMTIIARALEAKLEIPLSLKSLCSRRNECWEIEYICFQNIAINHMTKVRVVILWRVIIMSNLAFWCKWCKLRICISNR